MANNEMRMTLKQRRDEENQKHLNHLMQEVKSEGYEIQFGEIGKKTTYCLLTKEDEEILGYTFIQDIQYKDPVVGQLKSLQEAVVRKSVLHKDEQPENHS